jgi:hypothetical protein
VAFGTILAVVLLAAGWPPAAEAGLASLFVPKAETWPRWEQHDPADARVIDHGVWDAFLRKYVDTNHPSGINRMRYRTVAPEDRQALGAYLHRLAATPISTYSRREQLPFWINFYNALTVKLVLDRYPVHSIRDIKIPPGLFTIGPWSAKLVTVEGKKLSLNDMEHRILRPIWRDPRIHYAVNCASLGCPNLAGVAYTAENVDPLLTENAIAFVNHARGAKFLDGRLTVSSIYDWYEEDFGGGRAGVLRHLLQYARGELASRLGTYDRSYDDDYDWALNQP